MNIQKTGEILIIEATLNQGSAAVRHQPVTPYENQPSTILTKSTKSLNITQGW